MGLNRSIQGRGGLKRYLRGLKVVPESLRSDLRVPVVLDWFVTGFVFDPEGI